MTIVCLFPLLAPSSKVGKRGSDWRWGKKWSNAFSRPEAQNFITIKECCRFSAVWRKRIPQPCRYSYHLFWLYMDLHESEHISKLPYIIHPNYWMDCFSLQEIKLKETKHWFWNCISVFQETGLGFRFTLLNPRINRAKHLNFHSKSKDSKNTVVKYLKAKYCYWLSHVLPLY